MNKFDSFLAFKMEKYISGLDGFRAIAILLVFTAHPREQIWLGRIHGPIGVTLFFVVSGFLITHLLIQEEVARGKVNLKSFYIRRFFRIAPLYFFVLAIYVIVIVFFNFLPERREIFLQNLPLFLSPLPELTWFFHNSENAVPFNGAWSIGIEEKYYFVWPIVGFLLLRGKSGRRLVFLLFCLLFFSVCTFRDDIFLIFAPYAPIAIGSIIAIILNNCSAYLFIERISRSCLRYFILTAALALALLSSEALVGGYFYLLQSFLIGCVLLFYIASRDVWFLFLRSRFFIFLGTISYSFYLTHNFAINFVELLIPRSNSVFFEFLTALASFALATLLATVINRFVEVPARNFGRRLSTKF